MNRRPVLVWRAGSDQIAHAHEFKALRTLCNERIVLHRLAWPPARKCPRCLAAAEGVSMA